MDTILIERVIDAPRERVWQAWVKPEELKEWFSAGDGWTTPYAKADARVGGKFDIGFQSPDRKSDFPFTGVYNEVVENEKIVFTIADGRPVTVLFSDEGGKTKISLTLTLEKTNSAEQQRHGWTAMLINLGEYVSKH